MSLLENIQNNATNIAITVIVILTIYYTLLHKIVSTVSNAKRLSSEIKWKKEQSPTIEKLEKDAVSKENDKKSDTKQADSNTSESQKTTEKQTKTKGKSKNKSEV